MIGDMPQPSSSSQSIPSQDNQQIQSYSGGMPQTSNYVHPGQLQEAQQAMASLTKLLFEASNTLIALRREFRGEALYQDENGNSTWIQISKPVFVKIDYIRKFFQFINY